MKDSSKNDIGNNEVPGGTGANSASSEGHLKNDLFPEFCVVWLAENLMDAAPRRVRRALEKQIDAVVHSIETFGFRLPILVRHKAGGDRCEMVDGHVRLEAARRLGAERLPCILVDDLSDVDLRRLTLSLNKLQETGAWDHNTLKLEIDEIIEIDGDFEFPGFELVEIEGIHFGAGEPDAPDPADDLSKPEWEGMEAVSRPGMSGPRRSPAFVRHGL